MSSRARLLLVLATVVVLGGGFVLASRAGDEETAREPAAATATPPAPAREGPTATTGTRTEAQEGQEAGTDDAPAAPRVPTLVVEDGRPRGEVRELTFSKGERVRFRVRSDVAEELHIHGYDRYVDVAAGATTTVSFPASIEGIFEVELHGAGQQLASLRVEP
jgi:hypothetical protein